MSLLDSLRYRIRAAFHRERLDREIEEELGLYVELDAMQRRHQGMTADDARRRARHHAGNLTVLREELRAMSILRVLDVTAQDARYTIRTLARSPVFTLVVLATLALGIGATTAIFSLMHAVLFATLPIPRADELVQLQLSGQRIVDQFPLDVYRRWRQAEDGRVVSGFAASAQTVARLQVGSSDDYIGVDLVSGNYFATLGVRAHRGRLLDDNDERQSASAVVIGDAFWQRYFDRDPSVIGKTMLLNAVPFTIVGLAPADFNGIKFPAAFDIAIPMSTAPLIALNPASELRRSVTIIARLFRGATMIRAGSELQAGFRDCCAQTANGLFAAAGKDPRITIRSIAHGIPSLKENIREEYRRILIILMCGVASLLLITCVNVANLMLSRAVMRQPEFTVRLSLGASRWRVVRQCLTETVILSTLGGGLGVGFAAAALRVLAGQLSADTASRMGTVVEFHATLPILLFAAEVSLLTGLIFGVMPAVRTTAVDLSQSLRAAGRSIGGRADGALRKAFVVTQFVLSLVLLVVAGLFARSLGNLKSDALGFAPSHILISGIDARGTTYQARPLVPVFDEILNRAAALPGVDAVSVSSYTPVAGGLNLQTGVTVAGYVPNPGEDAPQFDYVSSDFFVTMGIRIVAGRSFTKDESHGAAHVAVVNRAFARRYFGTASAVGREFQIPEDVVIVGIADDARFDGPGSTAGPMIFLPYAQWPDDWRGHLGIAVRTAGDPAAVAQDVRRLLSQIAPGIRRRRVSTLEEQLDRTLERQRFAAALSTLFGMLAICLVAVGLYGVVAYLAASRTTEFGVRMALGARPSAVMWMVLRESIVLSALGIVIGLPLALGAARFSAHQLFKVPAADPITILGGAAILLFVATVSALIPAARASRSDPVIALRGT